MPTTDIPSNTISPELAGNTPVIKLNSVVLPAPFGPMTPNTSPLFNTKGYTCEAATLLPKLYLRHLILIAFSSPPILVFSCCLRLYASKRSVNTCDSGIYGAF